MLSVGHNRSNQANFIRIPSDASPSIVKQLLVRKCQNRVSQSHKNHLDYSLKETYSSAHHWLYQWLEVRENIVSNRNYFEHFVKEFSKQRRQPVWENFLLKSFSRFVRCSDVWIITAGVNTTITKLIGEIIRTNPDPSRPIHLIVSSSTIDILSI